MESIDLRRFPHLLHLIFIRIPFLFFEKELRKTLLFALTCELTGAIYHWGTL
jgi:hypothetical protein